MTRLLSHNLSLRLALAACKYAGSFLHVLAVLLCLLILSSQLAQAAEWSSDYGIGVTVGYDDNFFLDRNDELETTSVDVGVVAGVERSTETSNVGVSIGANAIDYSESEIDDETSYDFLLTGERRGERLTSSLEVAYASELVTETELVDTGLNEAGGTRETANVSPGFTYQLSERNSILGMLRLSDVQYSLDEAVGDVTNLLVDYEEVSVLGGWDHRLSEIISIGLSLELIQFDPENDDTTDTTSVYFSYELDETATRTYTYRIGYSDVDGPDISDRDLDFRLTVENEIDDRNDLTIRLDRGFGGSGAGVLQETTLLAEWDRQISAESEFTLTAEATVIESRDFVSVTAGQSYQYTPQISFTASYRLRYQDEDLGSASSSTVFFSIFYSAL